MSYSSEHGFNDNKFLFAYGEKNIYFMLHQKFMTIHEYKNSTQKDEYEFLSQQNDEWKGNSLTIEHEGIVENGNDFTNCKKIQERDST